MRPYLINGETIFINPDMIVSRLRNLTYSQSWLLIIFIVAAILRCWNLFSIPFMHDELSSVVRADQDSFSGLIEKGVIPDNHPALVQLFLFYWISFFGNAEWIVKLPFISCGIISVYLAYVIAKKWFNETTALLTAVFLATLQFPVMYSQIARPYGSGMFFILLMVYFLNKLLLDKNYSWRVITGYIISAICCATDHHFCALVAMCVGLCGLILTEKIFLLKYILINSMVVLLYLPHLHVTLRQLSYGGLGGEGGWLAAPENNFLITFFYYAMQYSLPVIILMAAGILFFIFYNIRNLYDSGKFKLICLVLVLFPFFAGFYYSVKVSAIIQYSFMIFSFPFLLMFLFSFMNSSHKLIQSILISAFLFLNLFNLVYEREHFRIMYHQPYEAIVLNTKKLSDETTGNNYSAAFSVNPVYLSYYETKHDVKLKYSNFFREDYQCISCFTQWLDTVSTGYIILANLEPTMVNIARDKFPDIVFKDEGFSLDYYCLGRSKINPEEDKKVYELDFDSEPAGWNYDKVKISEDGANRIYKMDSLTEWGPGRKILLDSVVEGKYFTIDLSVGVKSENANSNALLSLSIFKNDSVIDFRSAALKDYPPSTDWRTIHISLPLELIIKSAPQPEGIYLDVLFWNIEKQNVLIDDLAITIRRGNKYFYSLFEKITD